MRLSKKTDKEAEQDLMNMNRRDAAAEMAKMRRAARRAKRREVRDRLKDACP